jgi:hypothetical protein
MPGVTATANAIDVAIRNQHGIDFFADVIRYMTEAFESRDPHDDVYDIIHEVADNAVPIYTNDRWDVFHSVGGHYFGETVAAEYGDLPKDMTEAAGMILYYIATMIGHEVLREMQESADV